MEASVSLNVKCWKENTLDKIDKYNIFVFGFDLNIVELGIVLQRPSLITISHTDKSTVVATFFL